jgi:hypothetical protein
MSVRKRTWTTAKGIEKEAWIADHVDQKGNRHLKTFYWPDAGNPALFTGPSASQKRRAV